MCETWGNLILSICKSKRKWNRWNRWIQRKMWNRWKQWNVWKMRNPWTKGQVSCRYVRGIMRVSTGYLGNIMRGASLQQAVISRSAGVVTLSAEAVVVVRLRSPSGLSGRRQKLHRSDILVARGGAQRNPWQKRGKAIDIGAGMCQRSECSCRGGVGLPHPQPLSL